MKYNMAVYVVGDFLRETRLRKGYTQEEVSYGICTPASLSRIENGAQKPGRLILEKLFERLGTENNLFNTFVNREEMELYMKAIHITLPDFDGKNPLRKNLLTFDEIMIINAIAILYVNNDEIMTAIQLDMWLKEYMENKLVDGKTKTAKYPMILYNLSCWLDDEGYHKESLEMAEQGLEFCIKYGNLFFFPILVANKGVALAGLGKMEEAKEQLHQAIMIFKSMKQNDHIQLIIDWCRTNYGIEF